MKRFVRIDGYFVVAGLGVTSVIAIVLCFRNSAPRINLPLSCFDEIFTNKATYCNYKFGLWALVAVA